MKKRQSKTMDIVNGPLLENILLFAWPLMVANILQITFHFADTVVIGKFASQEGLAAVGTTGPVTVFFMWGLNGLSLGANVLVSRLIGAKKYEDVPKAVCSGMLIGFAFGSGIALFGIAFAGILLKTLQTPADIYAKALLYIRIYFLSGTAIGLYDFGAAILRASGDTRGPTRYLALSGALNVVLNLLFVVVFHMGVAGVGIATVLSQYSAALMILSRLNKERGMLKLDVRRENIDGKLIGMMLKYGIPSALQNQMFSFSNMIVQSSINSFGSQFVAANTAANTIEEFGYVFVDAFPQATVTFTSQMFGAERTDRIRKTLLETFVICGIGAFLIGFFMREGGPFLLGFFTKDPEMIRLGMYRLRYVTFFLFMNGLLDVVVGSIRGMGYSTLPMIVTLFCVCGFRIGYILTFFQSHHTPEALYSCFPLSWGIALIFQSMIWIVIYRRVFRKEAVGYAE